jgi:hypothetical protein
MRVIVTALDALTGAAILDATHLTLDGILPVARAKVEEDQTSFLLALMELLAG